MKWLDDIKASASALRGWARLMAALAAVACGLLAVIAIALIVICMKM